MIGAVVGAAAALSAAPASASAGADAGAARPVALTAAPARVALAGSARTAVRVTNSGTKRVVVDAACAGFALDARGRPRIVRSGAVQSAARWLMFRPQHFALGPHATASVVIASKLPRHAEPGDHDALVLLSTRPLGSARVAVRVRMGVVVVVRAPGRTMRRLVLRRLRVARRGSRRALDVVVVNRGNVNESLTRARAVVAFRRGGGAAVTLVAPGRDLRPRTSGILEFPFRRLPRGAATAQVVIPGELGRSAVRRTYRLRL